MGDYSVSWNAVLAAGSATLGSPVVVDDAGEYLLSTLANRALLGGRKTSGVARSSATMESRAFDVQHNGMMADAALPTLGPGVQAFVRVTDAGELERAVVPSGSDDIVGQVDTAGNVLLFVGMWGLLLGLGAAAAPPDKSLQINNNGAFGAIPVGDEDDVCQVSGAAWTSGPGTRVAGTVGAVQYCNIDGGLSAAETAGHATGEVLTRGSDGIPLFAPLPATEDCTEPAEVHQTTTAWLDAECTETPQPDIRVLSARGQATTTTDDADQVLGFLPWTTIPDLGLGNQFDVDVVLQGGKELLEGAQSSFAQKLHATLLLDSNGDWGVLPSQTDSPTLDFEYSDPKGQWTPTAWSVVGDTDGIRIIVTPISALDVEWRWVIQAIAALNIPSGVPII